MREVNKRMYGIEKEMKKPLEYREKLKIEEVKPENERESVIISIGTRQESLCLTEAISLTHRFVNIFKFGTVVFVSSLEHHMKFVDCLNGITTNKILIPEMTSTLFDRSIICMQIGGVLKITRLCFSIKAEDLIRIYEIAKISNKFCGIALRISGKTAKAFAKDFMGAADGETKGKYSWKVKKTEGKFEMQVDRSLIFCSHKFCLYNSECEGKYPTLAVDLKKNYYSDAYDSGDNFDSDCLISECN
ncbi:hypothetical protein PENTCL1PPCAC_3387, partial [Pristionchus entomophagus]